MTTEICTVCGYTIAIDSTWDAHKASWGPVTLYFHPGCEPVYRLKLAPTLRDAVTRTVRRWKQRLTS